MWNQTDFYSDREIEQWVNITKHILILSLISIFRKFDLSVISAAQKAFDVLMPDQPDVIQFSISQVHLSYSISPWQPCCRTVV